MDLVLALTTFVIVVFILKVTLKHRSSCKLLPPGPTGIPLLGNILQIIRNPHLKLSHWAKKYGPLYTVRLGLREYSVKSVFLILDDGLHAVYGDIVFNSDKKFRALVVSNAKLLKQIFSLPASTGKFKTDTVLLTTRGPHGVINTEGDEWYEQRQFFLRSLIKHGFGSKTSLEPLILSEAEEVVEWIKNEMDRKGVVSLTEILSIATNNTLLTIVAGERLSLGNTRVSELLNNLLAYLQYTVKSGLCFLPILKYIAPSISGYNGLDKASQDLYEFINGYIEEHKRTFIPGVERDVIDCFLEHQRNATDPNSSFYGVRGEKNSVSCILEIFNAGGETTPRTLDWLLLYLSVEQQVQRKLHSEIDRVIGKNREPSIMDKPNMPYTEAVIAETLRKSSLVPLGLIHELLEDVRFQDYTLPKGMLLVANMYHVHHDTDTWEQPEKFRPERFLDVTESVVLNLENVVAFQPGRRTCLGEPLARDVIFLFATKIFQAFHVAPDPASGPPSFEPEVGIGLIAKPYKVVMKARF